MRLSSLGFLFEEAARNVRRNGLMSVAALGTTAVTMAVLGCALFFIAWIRQWVDEQPRKLIIAAFLEQRATRQQARDALERARKLEGVLHASLVTKEEAWKEFQAEDFREGSHLAEAIGGEIPLPDRIDITLSKPERAAAVTRALRDRKQFPQIETLRDSNDLLSRLVATSNVVRTVGAAAALMLLVATVFVIQNTIRLTIFARRREIRVMQLVGANPGFIRLPMLIEGVFVGVLGSVVASGLVWIVARQVSNLLSRYESPIGASLPAGASPAALAASLIVAGAAFGLLSSALALRRFLGRV